MSLIALNTAISGPTGTVAVGKTPVAAAALGDGTFAYVANWGDGTISEVNLQNELRRAGCLPVLTHPSAIWYDPAGGNLCRWEGRVQSPRSASLHGLS